MTASDSLQSPPARYPVWMQSIAIALMLAGVVATYYMPAGPGMYQVRGDFEQLHAYRIDFAREALFGDHPHLPAWYPREFLGSPFWANIQNFPLIPTRLLLLAFDPHGRYTYMLAINMAAMLAAGFTYLFLRRINIHPAGAAAAGWTFAACGFFSSRMSAGHLPLLEVYCALPLLLWIVESIHQAIEHQRGMMRWSCALTLSVFFLALAGHPQIPIYSCLAAGAYAIWRGWRRALWIGSSMLLGGSLAAFILVPMISLVGRSTRVLPLAPADNDLAIPYSRLLGFFLPWRDGVPIPLNGSQENPFIGNQAIFWDTVCYAGWLPWIAVLALAAALLICRTKPTLSRSAWFLVGLGIAGILLSVPLIRQVFGTPEFTIIRSPARLIYFSDFALAAALGAAIHLALSSSPRLWLRITVGILLLGHFIELRLFSRAFIFIVPTELSTQEQRVDKWLANLGDARIGMDGVLPIRQNRRFDDAGYFDSIMLARPYQALLALSDQAANANHQNVDASLYTLRALRAFGVKYVFNLNEKNNRPELIERDSFSGIHVFEVPSPARRIDFLPASQVRFDSESAILEWLRDEKTDAIDEMRIPDKYRPDGALESPANPVTGTLTADRADSDHINCAISVSVAGYLRIIESWDPGWQATLDGKPVDVVPGNGFLIAVPIPPGTHEVRLSYSTPGAELGIYSSILAVMVFAAGSMFFVRWRNRTKLPLPAS